MERRLLSFLVCPLCKGSLNYEEKRQELICTIDQLAYPIEDNIPVMLIHRARSLETQEK